MRDYCASVVPLPKPKGWPRSFSLGNTIYLVPPNSLSLVFSLQGLIASLLLSLGMIWLSLWQLPRTTPRWKRCNSYQSQARHPEAAAPDSLCAERKQNVSPRGPDLEPWRVGATCVHQRGSECLAWGREMTLQWMDRWVIVTPQVWEEALSAWPILSHLYWTSILHLALGSTGSAVVLNILRTPSLPSRSSSCVWSDIHEYQSSPYTTRSAEGSSQQN